MIPAYMPPSVGSLRGTITQAESLRVKWSVGHSLHYLCETEIIISFALSHALCTVPGWSIKLYLRGVLRSPRRLPVRSLRHCHQGVQRRVCVHEPHSLHRWNPPGSSRLYREQSTTVNSRIVQLLEHLAQARTKVSIQCENELRMDSSLLRLQQVSCLGSLLNRTARYPESNNKT